MSSTADVYRRVRNVLRGEILTLQTDLARMRLSAPVVYNSNGTVNTTKRVRVNLAADGSVASVTVENNPTP